jgi:hypothetical protein
MSKLGVNIVEVAALLVGKQEQGVFDAVFQLKAQRTKPQFMLERTVVVPGLQPIVTLAQCHGRLGGYSQAEVHHDVAGAHVGDKRAKAHPAAHGE